MREPQRAFDRVLEEGGLEGRLALVSRAGTQQERRRRYLDLAAETETIAVKLARFKDESSLDRFGNILDDDRERAVLRK
jgi:hypothetical protein